MTLTQTLDVVGTILWTITAVNLTVIAIIVVRDRREERLAREQRAHMLTKMENANATNETADDNDWSYHSDNEDKVDDNDVVERS